MTQWLMRWGLGLLALLLLLPVLALIGQTPFANPALWVYAKIGLIAEPLTVSLTQLGVALALALVLGIVSAWLINNYSFPLRRLLAWMQLAPLVLPAFVLGAMFDPVLNWLPAGVRLGLYSGLANYPLVYLLMRACLLSHNAEYWYASRSMGAGATASLWNIGVRLNRPVLAAACLLVAMEVLSDLATPRLIGVTSLANLLSREQGDAIPALLSQLSLGLLLVLLMLSLSERGLRGQRRFIQAVAGFRPMIAMPLGKSKYLVPALLLLFLPPLLGAIVPLALLLHSTVGQPVPDFGELALAGGYSLILAFSVALLATFFALLLSYWQHLYPSRAGRLMLTIASIGLVVPGLYMALAVQAPGQWLDSWFAPLWQPLGWHNGLISNSFGLALYVLLVRYLALGLLVLVAALAGLNHELGLAARSLGTTPGRSFARIETPLILPFVGISLLLIALQTIKESGVVLVLLWRFPTLVGKLATNLAVSPNLAAGAPYALGLGLLGVILLLLAMLLARIGMSK